MTSAPMLFRQRAGQSGFSSSGTTADDDEPDGAGAQVLECDVHVPTRFCGRFLMALGNAHAVDLGADHGAVGDIEILQ